MPSIVSSVMPYRQPIGCTKELKSGDRVVCVCVSGPRSTNNRATFNTSRCPKDVGLCERENRGTDKIPANSRDGGGGTWIFWKQAISIASHYQKFPL